MNNEIILASNRRAAQLLRQFGLDFRVAVGPTREFYGNPETAVSNGLNKAVNIARTPALTIGADTVVVVKYAGQTFGCSGGRSDARARWTSPQWLPVLPYAGLGQARTFAVSTK